MMKLKQKYLLLLLFVPLTAIFIGIFGDAPQAQAYSCATNADGSPARTKGGDTYYYNDDPSSDHYGRCMERNYNTEKAPCQPGKNNRGTCTAYANCENGSKPVNGQCVVRHPERDKPAGPTPTNNDGTQVASWECRKDSTGDLSPDVKFDQAQGKCVRNCAGKAKCTSNADDYHRAPQGADPTLSKDDPCYGFASQQQTDACKKGKGGDACDSYTNEDEKKACQKGYASQVCSGTAPGSQERQECTDGVAACLDQGLTGDDLKECIKNVEGTEDSKVEEQVNKTTPPANPPGAGKGDCGDAKTVIIKCAGSGEDALADILKQIIIILSIGIGVAAVGGIVYGAMLYTTARDSSSQTEKGMEVIRNVVIGILLYIFMIALINWLVPGGVIT